MSTTTTEPPLEVEGPAVVETTVPYRDFCFYENEVFYDFVFIAEGEGTSGGSVSPCMPIGLAETSTTVVVVTEAPAVVREHDLPATGPGADAALVAVVLLVSGAIASVIARWGKTHQK